MSGLFRRHAWHLPGVENEECALIARCLTSRRIGLAGGSAPARRAAAVRGSIAEPAAGQREQQSDHGTADCGRANMHLASWCVVCHGCFAILSHVFRVDHTNMINKSKTRSLESQRPGILSQESCVSFASP